MTANIVQIGKHRFICGLVWKSLSRPRDLWKEACDLARKIDADMLVIRKDQTTAQAGFSHTRDGARRGMYSLAAVVSKTLAVRGAVYDGQLQPVQHWLAALKLPDGKWFYCAVRNANFLPNGDFTGTKEEVIERLYSDYSQGGWNAVVGDQELAHYGFHNFAAKRIEDFLPRTRAGKIQVFRWWAMRPVGPERSWKPALVAGALTALLGTGGYAFWKTQQSKHEEEPPLPSDAAGNPPASASAAQSHPWTTKPLPLHIANACAGKFTLLTPGGWQLEEYTCTARGASYSWTRGGSTLRYLLAHVPGAVPDAEGNRARYTEPLTLESGADDTLADADTLLRSVVSRFQSLGITATISPLPHPATPFWKAFSLSINTGSLPPPAIAGMLSDPGIRLDKVIYRTGTWSLEGVIYAK